MKFEEKIKKKTLFMLKKFTKNSGSYVIMWKNMVQADNTLMKI